MIGLLKYKLKNDFDFFEAGKITSYINLYNYRFLRTNKELIKNIDRFTLDGIAMVTILNLFGFKSKRLSPDFSSYFLPLFSQANVLKMKTSFVGGSHKEIQVFQKIITDRFNQLQIIDSIDGYFKKEKSYEIAEQVIRSRAELVIIGMGTPKQEEFAVLLKELGFSGSIYTCGAFISQTAMSGLHFYPRIIDKLQLRWAFRIFKERNHLKRYFFYYPLSIWFLFIDSFKS